MSDALLEIKDLKVRYDKIAVIHGLSLRVESGSAVGLLGSNGAGKSTTMRSIFGQRQSSGEIIFEGESIAGLDAHQIARRGIAMVPEGRMVFPSLTVTNNLRVGSYPRKNGWKDQSTFDSVMDLFPELLPMLNRQAGILSGGQQQMLALGRALMAKPKLLVLDEPSLGLAPLLVKRIYVAIAQLQAQNMSILLAEQNAKVALNSVNYAYVLETGQIVEQGSSQELKSSNRVAEIYLGVTK
jgi:branched-chain amino acid transport system ATP-binding protein